MYSLLKSLVCSVHTGSERAVCPSVCQQHRAAKGPWPDNPSPPAEIYRAKQKTKTGGVFCFLVLFFRRKKSELFVLIHWFLIYLIVWSEGEGIAGGVGMVCDFRSFLVVNKFLIKTKINNEVIWLTRIVWVLRAWCILFLHANCCWKLLKIHHWETLVHCRLCLFNNSFIHTYNPWRGQYVCLLKTQASDVLPEIWWSLKCTALHEIWEHTNEKQGNIYEVCMYACNNR